MNFNHLGLKKLISIGYEGSPVSYTELSDSIVLSPTERKPYKIELTEVSDVDNNGSVNLTDVELLLRNSDSSLTILEGDGDFRSDESIEYLKEADIVVTNPPFSLFREYVAQLMEYKKDFLIIGNLNAVTYKEIFPLIKDNKMWLGCSLHATKCSFFVPDNYEGRNVFFEGGKRMAKVNNAVWFTNLDIAKRHEELIIYKNFNESDYPKYDNYEAINVDKVSDIPDEYYGVLGVPITFLDKYNPDQFEIIALGNSRDNFQPNKDYLHPIKHLKDGSEMNGGAINCVLAINYANKPSNTVYYTADNADYLVPPYARLLIKRRFYEN